MATLAAGLTIGLLTTLTQLSFASLLFTGQLQEGLAAGVGMALAGAVLVGLVLASLGSFPGTVGRPHELPVVVLSVLTARLTARLPIESPDADALATVIVMVAASSALFAVLCLLMARFRVGDLFRFLPYPVLGGFVAGTGALLIQGGIAVMLGIAADQSPWTLLATPAVLLLWLPGVLLALLMLVAARLWSSWITIPAILVAALAAFHLMLSVGGMDLAGARSAGLLPDPGAGASLGTVLPVLSAGGVAWNLLAQQIPDLFTVAFIAGLGTLLNASAIEVTVRRELDLNRELRVVGLANLLAACVGSPPGFHSLSSTALPDRMGARGRPVGLIAAAICLVALLGGQGLVGLIPRAVTGALLIFLGLSLLANWILDQRAYLAPLEFTVLLVILLCTVVAGWLTAVVVGLLLAVLLFTYEYSRTSAVRSILSGRTRRSNVDRSPSRCRILDHHGDAILIIALQGHLFFGSAHALLQTIRERLRLAEGRRPQWILLDMRLISGLDASALYTFRRLAQICEEFSIALRFSSIQPATLALLRRSGILSSEAEGREWFRDLEHGLEFCENELLAIHEPPDADRSCELLFASEDLSEREQRIHPRLLGYFERCTCPAGTVIIPQGAPPADLYFLVAGRVVVERERPEGGVPLRLRKMDPGTCIGEISFYLGSLTSASVVAEDPVVALRLSRRRLQRMEERDPQAAVLLHKLVARRLGERLVATNRLAAERAG